jgi:hypothetical protein
METPEKRYRSNLNFTVVTFFILVSLTTGFYLGLMASKGPLIETAHENEHTSIYENLWQYRTDIFNLLMIAVAYVFVVMIALVIFGRFRVLREKRGEITDLERLAELYKKGLLTREEFDRKKADVLDEEEP